MCDPGLVCPGPRLTGCRWVEDVMVLHQPGGMFRISYGDDQQRWIRRTALDLGEGQRSQVLYQRPSPLVAEWHGEQYGVLGQSADGTEVRLLKLDEELAEILSARLDEVRLIEADFAPQHLPILIGDANGIFRRLEPAADSEEISQQYEVPRAAKHGDEL